MFRLATAISSQLYFNMMHVALTHANENKQVPTLMIDNLTKHKNMNRICFS